MSRKISSEQYWKLYKTLPQPLQEALSSDETADSLENICEKYKATDYIFNIVDSTSEVLLGLLPPDELQGVLEKETELEKETAKKIVQEINRFIFYQVKSNLKELYENI